MQPAHEKLATFVSNSVFKPIYSLAYFKLEPLAPCIRRVALLHRGPCPNELRDSLANPAPVHPAEHNDTVHHQPDVRAELKRTRLAQLAPVPCVSLF